MLIEKYKVYCLAAQKHKPHLTGNCQLSMKFLTVIFMYLGLSQNIFGISQVVIIFIEIEF